MILFICKFCKSERPTKKSLIGHETFCKSNPNKKIQNTENARKAAASKTESCIFCETKLRKCDVTSHQKKCLKNPENIKICLNCNTPTARGFYCSTKCGITFSNKNRVRSKEVNEKISKSLTGRKHSHGNGQKFCKIQAVYCQLCQSPFILKTWSNFRKTCSEKCRIELTFSNRKYVNGKRKTIQYFCESENKNVFLESSWELEIAEFLDDNDIRWIRPRSISWINKENQNKRYFPDFYLIDYDLYLDPKNEYCMKLDKDKMEYVSSRINIVYGHKDLIKEQILSHTHC